jgi:tetratricopeptide (TPR) repeat protein
VTTGSLEALRKYSEAYRANNTGDLPTAIARGREAVAIDSNFAFAWRIIGQAMSNAAMPRAPQDSAFERAYRLRDRVTERERLWITGGYYQNGPGRDRGKAVAAYEALMAAGDTAVAGNNLGLIFRERREFDRSDSMFALARRADSAMSFPWGNRNEPLVSSGRVADAEKAIAEYRQQFPASTVPARQALLLSYHRGRIDEYRRGVDSLQGARTPVVRSWAAYRKSELALRDGRWAESRRLFAEARGIDSVRGIARTPLADSATLGILEVIVRGRDPRVVARLDATVASLPFRALGEPDRPYFAIASLYAMAGRPDKAKSVMARYDADITDTALKRAQRPGYNTTLGEIALAEGRGRDAIMAFRKGDSLPDGPANQCTICLSARLGRAFDAAGQPDSAIAQYEAYLNTPYANRHLGPLDPGLLAGIHRRLGELYEAKGDQSKAIEHYERFVELWKTAQPELQPQVDDARRRIARLREVQRRKG